MHYVRMYVCTHVRMYVCTYACMYVCVTWRLCDYMVALFYIVFALEFRLKRIQH